MVSGYYGFVKRITPMKNDPKEEEKLSSGNTNSIVGRISRFFTTGNRNRSNISGSFEDDDANDDDSIHSVPEVVTTTKGSDSAQQVFKKSRSRKSFVFDNSIEEIFSNEDSTDMHKLNERVSSAMKLQKRVSDLMISQKAKNGTLGIDFDGDGTASVNSI
jgi:hypothetical protein